MPTLLCNSAYYSGTLRDIQQNCCTLKWCWLQLVFEVVFMCSILPHLENDAFKWLLNATQLSKAVEILKVAELSHFTLLDSTGVRE